MLFQGNLIRQNIQIIFLLKLNVYNQSYSSYTRFFFTANIIEGLSDGQNDMSRYCAVNQLQLTHERSLLALRSTALFLLPACLLYY